MTAGRGFGPARFPTSQTGTQMANEPMRVRAEFYMNTVQDHNETRMRGRPMFKDVEYVKVRRIGDDKFELVAPAGEKTIRDPNDRSGQKWLSYADRFPDEYKAFKANVQYIGPGTPIDEAPFLTAARRMELKALGVYTIDALADPTTQLLQELGMGGREMVNKAKAYIESANGAAPFNAMAEENARLAAQLEALRSQVEQLTGKVAATADPALIAEDDAPSSSPFVAWPDEQIKAWIKDKTGYAPRGNPSHATLVRMADEANANLVTEAA